MAKDEEDFPDDEGLRRIVKYDPVEEEGMPSCPAPEDWRAELVWAYYHIFHPPDGHPAAERLPDCGIGWLGILDRVCNTIQRALNDDDGDTIKLVQIKEKHATLRIYWEGNRSARAIHEVEEAINLANAGSACTCEFCGEGRLYRRGDWLATACSLHAKGELVPISLGFENVRIVRGEVNGEIRICLAVDMIGRLELYRYRSRNSRHH